MNCARIDEQDVIAGYFGGRLGEDEARSFESHVLGCERCWTEMSTAAQIRAVEGLDVFAAPGPAHRSRRDFWTTLAAAAAVAVMILGLQHVARRPAPTESDTVWRGSKESGLALAVAREGSNAILLQWNAVPDAAVYDVEVFASNGESVWQRRTSENRARLDPTVLPWNRPGISFFVTVEAHDSMGQVVARSPRERLPRP